MKNFDRLTDITPEKVENLAWEIRKTLNTRQNKELPPLSVVYYQNVGSVTLVYIFWLDNSLSVGWSKRNSHTEECPSDKWNSETGVKIALRRAMLNDRIRGVKEC